MNMLARLSKGCLQYIMIEGESTPEFAASLRPFRFGVH